MGTTKLTVEFVISGVIIVLALFLLAGSIFPILGNTVALIESNSTWISANWALLAIIATSVCYGFGVISEYLGLITFEWLLDRVKEKRLKGFISANPLLMQKSPLLSKYKTNNGSEMRRKDISSFYGDMRFHVMMKNSRLYTEIEAYINRFLLIRVLFLAEIIVLVSFIIQFLNTHSTPTAFALIFIALIAWANFYAVKYQFEYYCRAIERSYKALLIENVEEHNANSIISQKQVDDEESDFNLG